MTVELPVRSVGEPQACAKGNHDNPVSSNHPGTVTLNTQWNIEYLNQYLPRGRGGTGAKPATVHAALGSCKFTEALQNPWTTLPKLKE